MATPEADTIAEAIEMFFSEHSDSQIGELLHHAGYGVERGHPTVEEFIKMVRCDWVSPPTKPPLDVQTEEGDA